MVALIVPRYPPVSTDEKSPKSERESTVQIALFAWSRNVSSVLLLSVYYLKCRSDPAYCFHLYFPPMPDNSLPCLIAKLFG